MICGFVGDVWMIDMLHVSLIRGFGGNSSVFWCDSLFESSGPG